MTNHAEVGRSTAEQVAGQVRAEMARHKKTTADLAVAIDTSPHTAGRRLNGEIPFDAVELVKIGMWLGVSPAIFLAAAGVKAAS